MSLSPERTQQNLPRIGMLATVRNRRAIVASVDPYDGLQGRLHLVRLEYLDADGPAEDSLIWEREHSPMVLEPAALPRVGLDAPMNPAEFDALQRATRWTALSPFVLPDEVEHRALPVAASFFGAIQAEDFQLVPLLKALRMPRVSLLLADDVGLGKTVEAGLILTELLLRRRIRRVLIICPAALRKQWAQEMRDKFSLGFETIDRAETFEIQKRLGLDANPWRTYPRIITSYYYLRQPDVLEQFRAACRQPEGSAQLPWDLLIVDESHNLMPSNFGEDSDLSKMLRTISPWFEHKLFLTATPHNGHTRCFTGMLEQLDPVRFTQTSELTPAQQERIEEVVVRRLKREINDLDRKAARTPRFSERIPEPLPLYFGRQERMVSIHFQEFRKRVKQLISSSSASERLAGSFAVEVLNKRLLSCPFTFADSWYRFKEGLAEEDGATSGEVRAARRAVGEDLDDDQEAESRIGHAAKTTGAWLRPLLPKLTEEISALDTALARLGMTGGGELPSEDVRYERLRQLLQDRLRDGTQWQKNERLIIFTEYKTTLDYLVRRLQADYKDEGAVRMLYGGMPLDQREEIKDAFNDADDPLRILVATDAASEGLNLQETARYILHYDIPFNPSRLDQRNGRLDRHGQARDVVVFHFASDDDADLRFLAYVVDKVHTIREELGSLGELFDAAFERRFEFMYDTDLVVEELDQSIEKRRGRTQIPSSADEQVNEAEQEAIRWLQQELDLTPDSLQDTLEQALGFGVGLPRFEAHQDGERVRLLMPSPPGWESVIDSSLRSDVGGKRKGGLPYLVFSPEYFVKSVNGRPVFRSAKDTVMMHLGHPMFQRCLALFARARFPGGGDWLPPSRWTVRRGTVPAGAEGLVLLTVEELAVNELRETFHHWVTTLRFPIINGELGKPLPHLPAGKDRVLAELFQSRREDLAEQADDLWAEVDVQIRSALRDYAAHLDSRISATLESQSESALKEEEDRFRNRIQEVRIAMRETSLNRLRGEQEKIEAERSSLLQAPALLQEVEAERTERIRAIDRRQQELEEELRRRQSHYQDLLDQLEREKLRVTKDLLPQRYTLRGQVQVFPVTVEIRLPEVTR